MELNSIGSRLRALRMSKGLSADRLAKKVGVSVMTIYKYERDEMNPSLLVMADICKFFGVSLDYIVWGK